MYMLTEVLNSSLGDINDVLSPSFSIPVSALSISVPNILELPAFVPILSPILPVPPDDPRNPPSNDIWFASI